MIKINRIVIWPREAALEGVLNEPYHLISIHDPGGEHVLPKSHMCVDVLPLCFMDIWPELFAVDKDADGNPATYEQTLLAEDPYKDYLMTEEHAEMVAEYVNNAYVPCIAIHCAAGVSRSPSMGMAVKEHYGVPVIDYRGVQRVTCPILNKHVYELTKNALKRCKV